VVFKVGCIRPCERKGKIQWNISYLSCKKAWRLPDTFSHILKILRVYYQAFSQRSQKIDYAFLDHAKMSIQNISRFSFTWRAPCSDGNKKIFRFKNLIFRLRFCVIHFISCVVICHSQEVA
jgi:hypothetical protein